MNGMSLVKEHIPAYISLGVYTVVGVVLRYFITFPCGSAFQSIHVQIGYDAIPFIIIGIGFGLFSFIFPNKKLSRIGRGVVTGLVLGFGSTTLFVLAFNPCG